MTLDRGSLCSFSISDIVHKQIQKHENISNILKYPSKLVEQVYHSHLTPSGEGVMPSLKPLSHFI